MLRIKPGVKLDGLAPQMVLAANIVHHAYQEAGSRDCTITSGSDGAHMEGSLHYSGRALDFRMHGLAEVGVNTVALLANIQVALGENFDCLLENRYGPREHIHVEWQPKG